MPPKPEPRQAEIEARLRERIRAVKSGKMTLLNAVRRKDDWIFHLGRSYLLLHPLTRHWMIFNPFRQTWEWTGVKAGQGVFKTNGSQVGIYKLPGAPDPPAWEEEEPATRFLSLQNFQTTIKCKKCGLANPGGAKFCSECGNKLA